MSSVSIDPQVAMFNSYFGIAEGTKNPHEQAFSSGIKESVFTFYNVLGVSSSPPAFADARQAQTVSAPPSSYYAPAVEQYHTHCRQHSSGLTNPLFWMWVGSHQPRPYHSYQHISVRSDITMRAGRVMEVAGVRQKDDKKNEDKAKRTIVVMGVCLALADIVASVAAVYVTAVAVKQACQAKIQKSRFTHIEKALQPNSIIPYSGPAQDDPRPHLNGIGKNLKKIGDREAKCSAFRAASIACLAAAGVGTVHAVLSGIACAIISGSASLMASSSGLAALAFFSASCAPPILLAIGTIAAVGAIIYLALKLYNKQSKDQKNAHAGLTHLDALTQLALQQAPPAYTYAIPSAPPLPQAQAPLPTPSAPPFPQSAPPPYSA